MQQVSNMSLLVSKYLNVSDFSFSIDGNYRLTVISEPIFNELMNSRWGFKLWNMEELQFSPFLIKNLLSILDWKKKIENVKQVQKCLKPPLFLMAVAWGWSAYSFYFVNVEKKTR